MQLRILLCIVAVLLLFPSAWAENNDYLIVPGERVGAITRSSSEADLRKAYGDENVAETDLDISEGEPERGMVIFPNDPERRIQVLWIDRQVKAHPKWIQIDDRRTQWKTDDGITIGTSLSELEGMNGRPFMLTGFGWDYSGTVLNWNGGALEKLKGSWGRIILRLEPEGD